MSTVKDEIIRKGLEATKFASLTIKRAMDDNRRFIESEKKAAESIGDIVESFSQHGWINALQKEAVAKTLGTHDGAIEIIKAMAVKLAEKTAALKQASVKTASEHGRAVDERELNGRPVAGSYDSESSPFVGARTHPDKTASDRVLLRVLES